MKNLLCIIVLLISCNDQPQAEKYSNFSLKNFFTNKAKELEKSGSGIKKTINKDGIVESQSLKKVDWQKEFQPFIVCDINIPAWHNSFRVDSSVNGDKLTVIYTAMENIPVKKLSVTWISNVVQNIHVVRTRNNIYYEIMDEYFYFPSGYRIIGSQKVHFMDKTTFTISAEFK